MQIEEFIKKRNELKQLIAKEGKSMLQDLFLDVFTQNPELEAIQWTQYTPSFNDGDPCVFRVGDPYFKIHDPSNKESEEDLDDIEDEEDNFRASYSLKNQTLKANLDKFGEKFEMVEDIFEDVFGDGRKITVRIKNGKIKFHTVEYGDY